jgi:hypothetical protein
MDLISIIIMALVIVCSQDAYNKIKDYMDKENNDN